MRARRKCAALSKFGVADTSVLHRHAEAFFETTK
jgi:hypothetical protein